MLSDFRLYRWFVGGRWYFYKLGKDTPDINMFSLWTKESPRYIDPKVMTLLYMEDRKARLWTKYFEK